MVANQSMGSSGKEYKGQLTAALTKVKMDEDKKYILNIPDMEGEPEKCLCDFWPLRIPESRICDPSAS